MPVGLTEENLNKISAEPHRPRSLSNVSAKSIEKAVAKFGIEAS